MDSLRISQFKPIDLDTKDLFDSYFSKNPPTISEYTFTNLFMWRKKYHFLYTELDNILFIIRTDIDDQIIRFFPPIGKDVSQVIPVLQEFMEHEKKAVQIERFDSALISVDPRLSVKNIEDRNNWDYIYLTKELAHFEGGKFANIRKKLNRFEKEHPVEFKRFDKHQIDVCLAMQEEWCAMRRCDEYDDLKDEHQAIREIVELWDILKFDGGLLYTNGKVIAYTLGELLNPNTLVCHVEKANPLFDGAYQAITKRFNALYENKTEFTNREQDLGDEGLRTAKERLHPVKFIEKVKVFL